MGNYYVNDLCSYYYSINAWVTIYAHSIFPIEPQEEWEVLEKVHICAITTYEKVISKTVANYSISSQGEEIVMW